MHTLRTGRYMQICFSQPAVLDADWTAWVRAANERRARLPGDWPDLTPCWALARYIQVQYILLLYYAHFDQNGGTDRYMLLRL